MIVYVRRFGWIGFSEYQIASYARAPDLIHHFRVRERMKKRKEVKQDSHHFIFFFVYVLFIYFLDPRLDQR